MLKTAVRLSTGILFAAGLAGSAFGQARPYPSADVQKTYERLLKEIDKIPMYDNHAHPGYADDSDVDAMASPPDESATLRLRDDNPEFVAGAKALFGYPYDDFKPEHAKWLAEKKSAAEKAGGTTYFDGVLDKLNVDICLANRAMMPAYLDTKRFHWVFFGDSFFYPFDNHDQAGSTPDMGVYVPLQEKMLSRWKKQEGADALPADLAGYVAFVHKTMEDNQKRGGVAIKFEAAYFRSLYFTDPPAEKAEAIYNKYRAGGVPSADEYRLFQDYIFRRIMHQAGKLHLPMHFHSAIGIGDYFSLHNGNVLNLENVLRDPRYAKTKFVLIHGGYPYTLEMIWLTAAKNVYTDSSLVGYYVYPSELKNILKQWISLYPERMMFGSDAFPFNDAVGAEETFWLAARSARTAVAAALAELVAEGAFTEEKALELARMYLHDNAARLYGGTK